MSDNACITVYVTTDGPDEARQIGRVVVEEELAACANVISGIISIFRWNGEAKEEEEAVLILKTRADLVDVLSKRIAILHSYDCPCIVAWPIIGGHEPYLDWIHQETVE